MLVPLDPASSQKLMIDYRDDEVADEIMDSDAIAEECEESKVHLNYIFATSDSQERM